MSDTCEAYFSNPGVEPLTILFFWLFQIFLFWFIREFIFPRKKL